MNASAEARMRATVQASNMESVPLERAPKVAVYTPPNSTPWDDAVTMALEYADIPYETIWDYEVLEGDLSEYEWIHLHHEDFTG
ncbi:MAG: asparagine synthetase B, partial [Gemmatimonadetes bacterium]|nr:asparagine synthetase B [Gemmatimonadota bacterium]NIX43782.1 asparagine synthetase B [Gemmatimonadota bacterium]